MRPAAGPGLSPRAVALLTILFGGLLGMFGGLSLAARGRPGTASAAAAAGMAVAAGAVALLHRRGRGGLIRPRIVAHRGASAEAPENSLEAFRRAEELGADALELDVRRAADGALVVIHDATLDRTTDARGQVADRPGAELEELGVPLLERVLEAHPTLEITVDVKDADATEAVAGRIRELGRAERTVLYVEDGTDLPAFRGYPGPRATSTGQAARMAWLYRWLPGLPRGSFPEMIHTPMRRWGLPLVTPGVVRAAHRAGRSVQAWTVNEPARMRRLARWGVDAIVTDEVRLAVDLFRGGA